MNINIFFAVVDSEDSVYESDDVPEEEIDALLEEGLPEDMKGPRSQRKKANDDQNKDNENEPNYEVREKAFLVGKII